MLRSSTGCSTPASHVFADAIALTPEATSRALAALVARGALVRLGRGRYALTERRGPGASVA